MGCTLGSRLIIIMSYGLSFWKSTSHHSLTLISHSSLCLPQPQAFRHSWNYWFDHIGVNADYVLSDEIQFSPLFAARRFMPSLFVFEPQYLRSYRAILWWRTLFQDGSPQVPEILQPHSAYICGKLKYHKCESNRPKPGWCTHCLDQGFSSLLAL